MGVVVVVFSKARVEGAGVGAVAGLTKARDWEGGGSLFLTSGRCVEGLR